MHTLTWYVTFNSPFLRCVYGYSKTHLELPVHVHVMSNMQECIYGT